MRRTVAIAALTLVLGLAIGFVWGRITAPGPRLARSAALAIFCSRSPSSVVVKRIALAIVWRWMKRSAPPLPFSASAWPAVTSTK